jgi:hypothetical protein
MVLPQRARKRESAFGRALVEAPFASSKPPSVVFFTRPFSFMVRDAQLAFATKSATANPPTEIFAPWARKRRERLEISFAFMDIENSFSLGA